MAQTLVARPAHRRALRVGRFPALPSALLIRLPALQVLLAEAEVQEVVVVA